MEMSHPATVFNGERRFEKSRKNSLTVMNPFRKFETLWQKRYPRGEP
jgi:hypothetical protein